ncbi:tyrosine-type recombinase/integrase [Candidatus Bipolaricaulota bacterium]|nr:tyrosine-type recombinase/integrase [Candidatus Bipolaricaulota bacterium]
MSPSSARRSPLSPYAALQPSTHRRGDRLLPQGPERSSEITWHESNISPHTLRHTFATDLYRETGKIRLVQKVLGHAGVFTTLIYTRLFNEEVESALKSFRQEAVAV